MITKLELIEYLKHTPENTNYNILYSSLYNGSNKEAVDEFIEVLSRGNLSLAALQPYLAKLYEDDKTISPEPLPPFSVDKLPNQNPLTFTGAVTGIYDGSEALTVEIPFGGGSTVELDTTLTQSGKAADAKAVGDALAGKQDTISDLATIRSGAAKGATALQTVPNTYRTALAQDVIDSDLSDRIEVIEGKEASWDAKSDFSGSYNDLTDKPTIPTEVTPLIGTTNELTPAQVYQAILAGTPVVVKYTDSTYGELSFTNFNVANGFMMMVSQTIVYYNSNYIFVGLAGRLALDGEWFFYSTSLAEKKDIPTVPSALKNPNALTIKIGSSTVTYDGSTAQTVTISDGTEVAY